MRKIYVKKDKKYWNEDNYLSKKSMKYNEMD